MISRDHLMKQNELIRVRSDKRLTLETSAFQIFHRGNSTFINSFHKTKFVNHSSTDVVAQFLEKLEILSDETFSRFENIDGRNLIHRALDDYF